LSVSNAVPDGEPSLQEILLGRRERQVLTAAERRTFRGQRVLVTGAGGSVGSELARQLAECGPARLTLVEHSEYNLFRLERELAEQFPDVPLEPVLGDVTRANDLRHVARAARPHVVYHAAAYKHVTMTERAVCGAVRTNVLGTLNAARAAEDVGARLVLVSTDKAAQPASVMGATKRAAELAALLYASSTFRPVAVRFGNVLGSSGSLLEIMLERLHEGRPIPITHENATRYFMTPREAVSLVLKADLLGRAGEIYWLDMGEPVRILDLAERLLAWAAAQGIRPVPIEIIGLRPGEKLREELTTQGLELCRTRHRRVWVARQPPVDRAAIVRVLRALREDVRRGDGLTALADLRAAVPEYVPSRQARDLAAASSLGQTTPASLARDRRLSA
jgi:FlaA1/EpsC-like NDP-sugar epimerase